MRYPHLPFMGEVATATMDSTCLSPAHPCSLALSLLFSPLSTDVRLCHVIALNLLFSPHSGGAHTKSVFVYSTVCACVYV